MAARECSGSFHDFVPVIMNSLYPEMFWQRPGVDPRFWSGGPVEFWPQGGALSPKFAQQGFSFKIVWNLHDFEKKLGGWGARASRPPGSAGRDSDFFATWFPSRPCPTPVIIPQAHTSRGRSITVTVSRHVSMSQGKGCSNKRYAKQNDAKYCSLALAWHWCTGTRCKAGVLSVIFRTSLNLHCIITSCLVWTFIWVDKNLNCLLISK